MYNLSFFEFCFEKGKAIIEMICLYFIYFLRKVVFKVKINYHYLELYFQTVIEKIALDQEKKIKI